LLAIIFSCKRSNSDITYETILEISSKIEYVGPNPPASPDYPKNIPAMRVYDRKLKESYTLTLKQISGFEYSEGTSYVLKVQVTELASPPIDGSSNTYKLISIISKK